MPNQYLANIHQFISEQILITRQQLRQVGENKDPRETVAIEARLNELQKMRDHLTQNYDLATQSYYST